LEFIQVDFALAGDPENVSRTSSSGNTPMTLTIGL